MKKKILILGINGMIGHKVFEVLSKYKNFEVFGTVKKKSEFFDFKNVYENVYVDKIETIEKIIQKVKPKVVINCTGITKQSDQINNISKSIIINALFPHQLSDICKKNKIRLITFTTDCVFDGQKGSYKDNDLPTCHDVYGMTKYLGEIKDKKNTLTLRTSIIGHELNSKIALLDWFLSQENTVKGYKKAIFSGFTTLEFAKLLAEKIIPDETLNGLYQISVDPISKYDLLKIIADVYKKNIKIVVDETVKIDRSLNSDILRQKINYQPPKWKDLVVEMYNDFQESDFYKNKRKEYEKTNKF
ncbi:MAG: SDR family oxidoreductase [Candidatus Shapirobacteria bacterium]